MNITHIKFDNYFKEIFNKIQIYLHHTVSPSRLHLGKSGIDGDVRYWLNQNNKVNTPYIIDSDGLIGQLYDPKYWAWHLGVKSKHFKPYGLPYRNLNKTSIGIELDNLGPLIKQGNKFVDATYKKYTVKNVITYDKPYRGYHHWEAYTDEQIESLRILLIQLTRDHGISVIYNDDIWDICERALAGESGIFSHTSVRPDKSDINPQPKLVHMLKTFYKNTQDPPIVLINK